MARKFYKTEAGWRKAVATAGFKVKAKWIRGKGIPHAVNTTLGLELQALDRNGKKVGAFSRQAKVLCDSASAFATFCRVSNISEAPRIL